MTHATMQMNGTTFVLVPKDEYEELVQRPEEPAMPDPDQDGNYDAMEATRVILARSIIRDRKAAGLTQRGLAGAAGIMPATLNRIEKAKVDPDTATLRKIDRAIKKAGAKSAVGARQ